MSPRRASTGTWAVDACQGAAWPQGADNVLLDQAGSQDPRSAILKLVCVFFFFLIEDVYYFFAGQTEHRWGVHREGVPCKGMYVAVSWEIVQGVFLAKGLGLVCHKHPTQPVLGLKLGSHPIGGLWRVSLFSQLLCWNSHSQCDGGAWS